jgi:predicted CxxxxCH...CXXCH cytochrome family protein
VGAHQKHVNPLASGQKASPFACTNCHASPLPSGVAHVNGAAVPIPFGGIAITGSVRPAFNPTTLSCSATYCHGNFTNGNSTAAPAWNGGAVTCTSCHLMPTTSTGEHSRHMGAGLNCSDCHSGIATGSGRAPSSNSQIVGPSLHVNGTVNVVIAPANSITTSGSGASRRCSGSCHGTSHSSETW